MLAVCEGYVVFVLYQCLSCFLITIMNVLFVSTNVGVVTCVMEQSTLFVVHISLILQMQELKQHLPESSVVSLCVRIANI